MEERICKVCGKQYPLEYFPKGGKYHLHTCKACKAKEMAEWRRKRAEQLEKETGRRRTEEESIKEARVSAKRRLASKLETGRTYRNQREAEQRRAYQREYEKVHKNDPRHKETQRKCARRVWERRQMKNQVNELDEFFSNDFFD